VVLAGLGLVAGCVTGPAGAPRLEPPRVLLKSIRAISVDAQGVTAQGTILVENPNPFPLRLDRVAYALTFEGRPTATGETTEPMDVPARGTVTAPVTMRAPVRAALAAGAVLLLMGELPYTLTLKLHFWSPVGSISVPLQQEGRLALRDLVPPTPDLGASPAAR
jgi:LEA14-like dessication related protein